MINFIYTHVFSNPKGGTLYLLAAILHLPSTLNPGQALSCSLFSWVCPFRAFYTNGSRQYVKLPSLASFFWYNIFMVHLGFGVCQYFIPLYSQILHQAYLLINFLLRLLILCVCIHRWVAAKRTYQRTICQVSSLLPLWDSWGWQVWWLAPHLTVSPTRCIPDFNYALVSIET